MSAVRLTVLGDFLREDKRGGSLELPQGENQVFLSVPPAHSTQHTAHSTQHTTTATTDSNKIFSC